MLRRMATKFISVALHCMRHHLPPHCIPWLFLHPGLSRNNPRLLHYARRSIKATRASDCRRSETSRPQPLDPHQDHAYRETVAVLGPSSGLLLRSGQLPISATEFCALAQSQGALGLREECLAYGTSCDWRCGSDHCWHDLRLAIAERSPMASNHRHAGRHIHWNHDSGCRERV